MSLSKAIEVINGINESASFFQLFRSAVSVLRSRWNGSQEKQLREDDVLQLESDLRCLTDTVLASYNLIDRAEWRIHDHSVAKHVSKLKHAVYDAEDLLDKFGWYKLKVEIEGQASQEPQLPPVIDFLLNVIHGSFNKVTDIQKRLTSLSEQLKDMGLHVATPCFDKSLRPVTTSFRTEPKIFGREKELEELEEVIGWLGVPKHSNRSSKRKRTSNAANNEPRIPYVPVLPIVGIGGVGKTTLAQEITTLQRVKSYFDKIIWICVSDDFDVERFTKVLIKSLSGEEATASNLDDLQQNLIEEVGKKRFLLILDDIWPDPSKRDEHRWRQFCAPLTNGIEGSMLLVTTRFAEVAEIVGTMESFLLEGLKDDVFWDFFKLCVFGQEDSRIDPQLEQIGRSILLKLKGTPLAAKTIGRLLRKSVDTAHWNGILNNELWEMPQKETDILPALLLSYMYLPSHLKRCFSFCAVYPKDYNFEKATLAEIWVAEGFVEPQGNIPLPCIGDQYFEELVNLSFFQKLRGKYVIHDLMHDMAQLVSEDECFIVKYTSEIEKVPLNVRHLMILSSCDLKSSNIVSLYKHTKLRTLICIKSLNSQSLYSVTDCCFNKLRSLRVISCASLGKLPESIGNLKHLRYLEISRKCSFNGLPPSFCSPYNLQILYARKCVLRGPLPKGISKLINLQKFETKIPKIEVDATGRVEQTRFTAEWSRSIEELRLEDLTIYNLCKISTGCAEEQELREKDYLNNLTLRWGYPDHNQIEVIQARHPPTSIKSIRLEGYPGQFLPRWYSLPELSRVTAKNNNGRVGTIFSSVTDLRIERCEKLLSFLQPAYIPAIRTISIVGCISLESVRIEQFENSASLKELNVHNCPNITFARLPPSLKTLKLENSGDLGGNIDCSAPTTLHISCGLLASIKLQNWSLPVLRGLTISSCESLTSIRESEQISTELSLGSASSSTGKFQLLSQLTIQYCGKLETLDDLLTHECLPAVEDIKIKGCRSLSLTTGRFGSFPFLKYLTIETCPRLNWQIGTVLSSSLQKLMLWSCGDLSACFPSCLESLASLKYLDIVSCQGTVSISRDLWRGNLISLQELRMMLLSDLESIGGPQAIEHIRAVYIHGCPKLKEVEQPLNRGN